MLAAFFWLPGLVLARLLKPVTTLLDDLEEEYLDFCREHGID